MSNRSIDERIDAATESLRGDDGIDDVETMAVRIELRRGDEEVAVEERRIYATSKGPSGIVALNHVATRHDLAMAADPKVESHTHVVRLPDDERNHLVWAAFRGTDVDDWTPVDIERDGGEGDDT